MDEKEVYDMLMELSMALHESEEEGIDFSIRIDNAWARITAWLEER